MATAITTLTRMKLVDILYDSHGFNRTEAKQLVDAFFEELCLALIQNETIKISGFGSFHVRNKRERIGRNPKTGEEFAIEPRTVVRFRASTKLREKINEKDTKTLSKSNVTDSAFEFTPK